MSTRKITASIALALSALVSFVFFFDMNVVSMVIPFISGVLTGIGLISLAISLANREKERMVRRISMELNKQSPLIHSDHPTRLVPGVDSKNVSLFIGNADDVVKASATRKHQ